MYLWKVDKLVEDFKTDKVSQKEEFKYMLLYTVLIMLLSDQSLSAGSSYSVNDFITTISILAISVWGIYYCYRINSSGDNKQYYVRVACIGIPIGMRIFVALIVTIILAVILEAVLVERALENNETPTYTVAITIIYTFAYYWYLAKKMKAVSS